MKHITAHLVEGDSVNSKLEIGAIDEPGSGGAYHKYVIAWGPLADSAINFQNGPIKEAGVNGITHEALLAIIIDRLEAFQAGPYANVYNERALFGAQYALDSLKARTIDRLARGVEGEMKK